jgi:monofunctional glycosyltransferase
MNKYKPPKNFKIRLSLAILKLVLLVVGISVFFVLPLRWINPPVTSYQIIDALHNTADPLRVKSGRWLNYAELSAEMKLAVIAAEDQRFPDHFGLDVQAIWDAYQNNQSGHRIKGGSTITQQLAKNLWLWPQRSYLRKVVEAWFTVWIELLWSKQRILEVYLNVVEFGPHIFGVDTAAENFFHQSGSLLNRQQAALLAAVLPSPKTYNVREPSGYLRRRQQWIVSQMRQLGGVKYLQKLVGDR